MNALYYSTPHARKEIAMPAYLVEKKQMVVVGAGRELQMYPSEQVWRILGRPRRLLWACGPMAVQGHRGTA